jgi:hypothetical protein
VHYHPCSINSASDPFMMVYFNNGASPVKSAPGENPSDTVMTAGAYYIGATTLNASGPDMGPYAFDLLFNVKGDPAFVNDNFLSQTGLQDPTRVWWRLRREGPWVWTFQGAAFYYSGRWHELPPWYARTYFQAPGGAHIHWYRVCSSAAYEPQVPDYPNYPPSSGKLRLLIARM